MDIAGAARGANVQAAALGSEPPDPRAVLPGEVHLSWASLDVCQPEIDGAARLLSPDEVARAARFVFPLHRARFIVARAALRRLLAAYTGSPPQDLRFARGPMGKPMLAHPGVELGFNLSHSGGYAAYAVTAGGDVGVDLEVVRPLADLESVATQFFSPRENEDLRSLSGADRLRGFYECWTRKEAFLKATGVGLARPLDSFSVTLGPHLPPRIQDTSPDAEERDRWSLFSLEPRPGILTAVALPRGEWRLRCADASSLREGDANPS